MKRALLALISASALATPTDWTDVAKLDYSIHRAKGFEKCALRRNAAEALSAAAANFRLRGVALRVSGCYVPSSSAQPACGEHARGDVVDVKLVDRQGAPVDDDRRLVAEMRRAGFAREGAAKSHFVFTAAGARPAPDDVPLTAIK